jgi:hypothetical protein
MNKQFNAVALANKALSKENMELWDKVDTLERGTEELHMVYGSRIMQLVQMLGEATLPKIDIAEYMGKYVLAAEKHEDGSITLRVDERTEDDDGPECED